jgi:hypothetical protein
MIAAIIAVASTAIDFEPIPRFYKDEISNGQLVTDIKKSEGGGNQ